MLTSCETKLLGQLIRKPLEAQSINQLAQNIKRAYPHVYNSVQGLEKKGLLTITTVGRSSLCRIRFDYPEQLTLVSIETSQEFLSKHLHLNNLFHQLKEELSAELYIAVIFGSYAKGKATKKSDIDLFFIVQEESKLEVFKNKVNSVLNKLNYNVDFEVSTMDWFYEMLGEKNTVGREIFEASIILHNAEAYFYLVRKHVQRKGY